MRGRQQRVTADDTLHVQGLQRMKGCQGERLEHWDPACAPQC